MAFNYPNRPIYTLPGLSIALGVPLRILQDLTRRANKLYRACEPIPKPDGSTRQTYDAFPALKSVHKKIQSHFLSRVVFPDYLTGSLRGRDPVRNAALHAGAKVIVCEDIKGFFPNTTSEVVRSIWAGFFKFGPAVASVLTSLTTRDGVLPEGAVTSSYLANLAFWNVEPTLVERFEQCGVTYSRYVDDITISSECEMTKEELTWCIAQVYGMMKSRGYRAKRNKHEIQRAHDRMFTTKVLVNKRPALTGTQRNGVRAAVHELETKIGRGDVVSSKELNSAAGRVGRVKRLHLSEGEALKARINLVREAMKD